MAKVCDLGIKKLMTDAIKGRIATDPRTNGMEEGKAYPATTERVAGLNAIQNDYPSSLYRVEPGGDNLTFFITINEDAAESYNQKDNTSWQKANRLDKPDNSLDAIASGLRAQIKGNVSKLTQYVESVLLSAKRLSDAAKGNSQVQEAMSEIWTSLKQDPDVSSKLRMVAHYLSEAHAFMQNAAKTVQGMDFSDPTTKDANVMTIMEIQSTVDQYAPMVIEFHKFLSAAEKDNPVWQLIKETKSDMEIIKAVSTRAAEAVSIEELVKTLTPSLEKAQAGVESQIRELELQKTKVSKSEGVAIDKKIAKLRADFDALAPTRKNIEATLIGKGADSTYIGKMLLAGALNRDILIQGFMKIIKDKMQAAQVEFMEIGAEIGQKYDALLKTGFSDSNIEEAFNELYVDVEEHYFNDTTGEIEVITQKYFASEQNESWRTEFTQKKAVLTQKGRQILKARGENATRTELSLLEAEYDVLKTDYIKFRRENFETEYGDRYQAADAMLDTVVNFKGETKSLREIRSFYYDQIGKIQDEVAALSGVPSPDEVAEMNRLRSEFEAIKSMEGKFGENLRIAQMFQAHAAEMKEMTDRWEASSSSLDKFNLRKAKVDKEYEAGEIDKEARDRWYMANTSTVYDSKYWAERKLTVDKMNAIAEQMSRITGFARESTMKGNYERMEMLCKKYRDFNSYIDGTKLTDVERQTIREIEEEIEAVKQEMKRTHSSFLGETFENAYNKMEEDRRALLEEVKQLQREDPSNSTWTKQRVAEIRKKQRELRSGEDKLAAKILKERGVSDTDIATYQSLYNSFKGAVRQLSELTESTETEYYYETFQNELNKFVAGKTQAERDAKIAKTKEVRIGKIKYRKSGTSFYEVLFDGTLAVEETPGEAILDHLFKKEFENSVWYQRNHFLSERYDRNAGETREQMIPIYAWRVSKPADPRWIKDHAPNISWKRRVIKEEFKNPNFGFTNDGIPKIKAGKHMNTEYAALRARNPALWEFRDYMIGVFLNAQNEYPAGKGLGMRVPSIERDNSGYSNFQRGFKGLGTQIKRTFQLNAQDVDDGLFAYSDDAGYEKKFVPVKFSSRLEADLVSKNIVETIGQYAGQSKMYRARNELLDIGKALETTLSFEGHGPASESLDKAASFFGVFKMNKKRGVHERLDTVKNMIDMFVYGENMVESTEKGKKVHKLISNLLGIRAATLFSELPNALSWAVNGTGDLAGTFWAQLVNKIGGESQMLIKTAIKSGTARFSLTDYLWANKEYTTNSAAFIQDVGKVSGRSFWTEFADFFDARELNYVDNFGKQLYSKGLGRQVNFSNLAFFKNVVEHELMMKATIAFAKGYHIDTPMGKMSLKDAFTVEGGKLTPKFPISDAELADIRGSIASLLRDINGNYGKLDKTMIEQYWLGRTITFMRKWMVPMIVARYGGQKYSVEQDRVTRGYIWESMLLTKDAFAGFNQTGFRGIGAILLPEIGTTLTTQERDALKQTRLEIGIMLALWLTYRFALGYDDDDEERFQDLKKESYFLQGLTYSLVKANSELSTFLPILGFDEAKKVVGRPLANAAPVVGDLYDIIMDDIDWHLNPMDIEFERYKRRTGLNEAGDLKATAHLYKLLGLTTLKQDPVEALKSFESNLNSSK